MWLCLCPSVEWIFCTFISGWYWLCPSLGGAKFIAATVLLPLLFTLNKVPKVICPLGFLHHLRFSSKVIFQGRSFVYFKASCFSSEFTVLSLFFFSFVFHFKVCGSQILQYIHIWIWFSKYALPVSSTWTLGELSPRWLMVQVLAQHVMNQWDNSPKGNGSDYTPKHIVQNQCVSFPDTCSINLFQVRCELWVNYFRGTLTILPNFDIFPIQGASHSLHFFFHKGNLTFVSQTMIRTYKKWNFGDEFNIDK